MKGLACIVIATSLLPGCERAKQDMYDQPRYKTYAPSPLFEDGASARPPVAGTVFSIDACRPVQHRPWIVTEPRQP